jgi:4-hydroxy-tetrahydrodipicolinate reductase
VKKEEERMTISVCVAGATGWTGRAVAEAILAANDLTLKSAVSRTHAGQDLGVAWSTGPLDVPVFGNVAAALDGVDVLVDYTSHQVVLANTMAAIESGVGVVIGSSGVTADQFCDIAAAAQAAGVGVIASGNFSVTAAIAQLAAIMAARFLPSWEIIDYASDTKPDAPSGTALELAERLSEVRPPLVSVPIADTAGSVEARGGTIKSTQVHSLRLASYSVSTEVVFGCPDERLTIRHDAGSGAHPYVEGTLLAIRETPSKVGLTRGLGDLLQAREVGSHDV